MLVEFLRDCEAHLTEGLRVTLALALAPCAARLVWEGDFEASTISEYQWGGS